jgi:predicted AAA+ superfamily ATPase
MMDGRLSPVGAMNEAILAIFQQAYQDLALFPLIEPEDIEKFRVDYGREVLVRLRQEVNASTKAQKFVFAGHRGCGKSTLLKRFTVEMQPQHFTVVAVSCGNWCELPESVALNVWCNWNWNPIALT